MGAKQSANSKKEQEKENKDNKPIQQEEAELPRIQTKRLQTKVKTKKGAVAEIYNTERSTILKENSLLINVTQLPKFDSSKIFWLEALGEGGCGTVQKAYDKHESEFIAIKRFPNMQEESNKEKWSEIMLEHDMLQSIEKIRSSRKLNEEYFLKYGGVFREAENPNSLILQMESGRVSLEDILRAGKSYTYPELMHIHRKLTAGFLLLQENGIANRDVKPGNVILVDNPGKKGSFHYKISDFGISCKLEKGVSTVPVASISGYTEEFVAPEVLLLEEAEEDEEEEGTKDENPKVEANYNPFLADVFSFGVLTLKMINRRWKRKDINEENLNDPELLKGFEPMVKLLVGMLEEDPQNRWDFERISNFHKDLEYGTEFKTVRPTDEVEYSHIYQIEIKEKKMEQTVEKLEKLFNEHENMFTAYKDNVTRPNEEKFHLDRAWYALEKLLENLPEDGERKLDVQQEQIRFLVRFGNWFLRMGNLKSAEENLNQARKKIDEFRAKNKTKIEKIDRKTNEVEAFLILNFGSLYTSMGNLPKSEEFFLESLKIYKGLFGEDHSDVAMCLNNLGELYKNMGNLQKSEEFYLKSLKIRQTLFGEKNPDVAMSLTHLGVLYKTMGNLPKAEEVYLSSLQIRQSLFGENHSSVAMSLNNLGSLYETMGDLVKAEEYSLKSLKIHRILYDETHADVATSLNNLGGLYMNMGKFPQAKTIYQKAMKIYHDLFGDENSDVAMALNNIGVLYYQMGDLPKSETHHLMAIRKRRNLFGENHLSVADSLNNLGLVYEAMGNLPKAEEFYLKALKISQDLFGKNHLRTAYLLNNLGDLYRNMGNFKKAEEFSLQSLKINQESYGEKNSNVATSLNNLGSLYENMGKLSKAEEFYLKSFKIRQDLFGENHTKVADSLNNLGTVYAYMGNLQKSEEFYLKSLKIRQDLFGEKNIQVVGSFDNLAETYKKMGNLEKAEECTMKSQKIKQDLESKN